MLPCCGHLLITNEELTEVDICGCPNGIDWSVIHDGDNIKMITESQNETVISLEEYRQKVYAFADKIENYYNSCTPKLPEDDFDAKGYTAFWNEWHRRRIHMGELHDSDFPKEE